VSNHSVTFSATSSVATPSTDRPAFWRGVACTALTLVVTTGFQARAGDLSVLLTKADGSPAPDTVVVVQPVAAWAARPAGEPVVVTQKDLRFVPYVTALPVGGTLRLTNQDQYDHHVRSMAGGPLGNVPPATSFEFRLPAAKGKESSTEIKLDTVGSITLGCHIHGSMRGHVFVSASPWVGVTDEQGRLKLAGVPEGAANLRLWHPDQLSEQASRTVQVASTAQDLQASLNFSPRKRRPAPTTGSTYGY
jgi:plastocyanin